MKITYDQFLQFCQAFEALSGYVFDVSRIRSGSATTAYVYEARYRDETNYKVLVKILLETNGQLRWETGWDQAGMDLYEMWEEWFCPNEGWPDDLNHKLAS
ncbi:hypothetical protein [Paenibacillus jiagnxiensis]|uniref:hypothetical protein n=1 Tax=Paenibacillus jiagnxiensis TaxID=3228926 RepID=UPI0033B22F1F